MSRQLKNLVEDVTPLDFRLSATLPRVMTGVTAAASVLAATLYIFGPFSDLSARQLAAGPHSTVMGPGNTPLVLARTGRSWGGGSQSEPGTRLALATKGDSARQTPAGAFLSQTKVQTAELASGRN